MQTAIDITSHEARQATKPPAATAFAYTVPDTRRMCGVGTTTVYKLLKEGRIRKLKVGTRTLVCGASLRSYLASLGASLAPAA